MKKHLKSLSFVLACMLVVAMLPAAAFAKQGDKTSFKLGNTGAISNCGNFPTFQFRATGDASAQVTFYVKTSGGVTYKVGYLPAASPGWYINHEYTVINGGGSWTFWADVTSGGSGATITCTVEQIY